MGAVAAITASPGADAPASGTSVEAPRTIATSTTRMKASMNMADEALDGLPGWHRQVAVDTFNAAWELIDLSVRTPAQDRELLGLAFTSRFHWGVVGGDEEHMVGDWMIAHVASLQGFGDLAHRYASTALDTARANGWDDWRLASMLEGMARASAALGDGPARDRYAAEARRVLATLDDSNDRELIASQLASIPGIQAL